MVRWVVWFTVSGAARRDSARLRVQFGVYSLADEASGFKGSSILSLALDPEALYQTSELILRLQQRRTLNCKVLSCSKPGISTPPQPKPNPEAQAFPAKAEAGVLNSQEGPWPSSARYSSWDIGWSLTKKHWCCHHESRGCHCARMYVRAATIF